MEKHDQLLFQAVLILRSFNKNIKLTVCDYKKCTF